MSLETGKAAGKWGCACVEGPVVSAMALSPQTPVRLLARQPNQHFPHCSTGVSPSVRSGACSATLGGAQAGAGAPRHPPRGGGGRGGRRKPAHHPLRNPAGAPVGNPGWQCQVAWDPALAKAESSANLNQMPREGGGNQGIIGRQRSVYMWCLRTPL
jgi:hypothetical protein